MTLYGFATHLGQLKLVSDFEKLGITKTLLLICNTQVSFDSFLFA